MNRLSLLTLLFASAALAQDGGLSPGWFSNEKNPGEYRVEAVEPGACGGRAVMAESVMAAKGNVAVMQRFRADRYRGSRIRLSATLDAKDVAGWAGVWMRVDGPEAKILGFDNMQNRPVQGTQACVDASVVLDVPDYAEVITLGVVLNGPGHVELSHFSLGAVGPEVKSTNLAPPPDLTLSDGGWLLAALPKVAATKPKAPRGDPLYDDALGRVGRVWFSDRIITSIAPEMGGVSHLVGPKKWSDRQGDFTSTMVGDVIRMHAFLYDGEFTVRREGDTTIFEGTWGKAGIAYPTSIRLSPTFIDMKWGFYERHLVVELKNREQTPPECYVFSRRSSDDANATIDDSLQVCGEVLSVRPPLQQTLAAFLLVGFYRWGGW